MSEDFLSHWFKGLDQSLSELDDKSIEILLTRCGEACSDSFTRQIYIDEYAKSKNLDDFILRLNSKFKEMKIRRVTESKIEIIYTFCACDLVKKGYITNPKLCLCSQKSLQSNWETVLGKNNVIVKLNKSILAKDDFCHFTVELLSNEK